MKAEILAIIRAAQRHDRDLKVQVEFPLHVQPGWTREDAPICQVAKQAVRAVLGETPRLRMHGGFTDMHFLTQDARIPSIGYGSYGGGAHGDFEFITTSDLLQAAKVYAHIIGRLPD